MERKFVAIIPFGKRGIVKLFLIETKEGYELHPELVSGSEKVEGVIKITSKPPEGGEKKTN